MTAVARLVTVVDLDGAAAPGARNPRVMSVSALHLAVLDDGRRLLLLDDRGWSMHGQPDIWRDTSVDEITTTARVVVGPDEPFDDHTRADMAADHWAVLAATLRQRDVLVGGPELSRLPHDVELSEQLLLRLAGAGASS